MFVEETSRVVMALLETMVVVNMMAAMDLVEMESILEVMEATTSAITKAIFKFWTCEEKKLWRQKL